MNTQVTLDCPLCNHQATFFFADPKNYQHRYHHCLHCDLVFVDPECRLDDEAEKARYDMHINDDSEHYVNFLSRLATPMLNQLSNRATPVKQIKQDKPIKQIKFSGLDFGSGKSQAMAKLFRRAGHSCQCYDIFYYPEHALLTKSYDFIVASEVIEHLYQPQTVIEQWLAMLKPNGILGIMTGLRPDDDAFGNWWYKNDPTHVSLFSRKTFAYLQKHYHLSCLYEAKNVLLFEKGQ